MRFELTMDHVSVGMSFRQTVVAIQHAKDRTKTAKLIVINDLIIEQYIRVIVAYSLQQIDDMVDNDSVWAMSLDGDSSTHHGQSFFDLRLCICYCGNLLNLHLVAIPMFDQHIAVIIFNMLTKFLDTLYANWRAKLIGMSLNSETTMISHLGGLVTLIVACAENNVLCIWCPLHQIDIVVKSATEDINVIMWVKFTYMFSVLLRAQNNFIINMGSNARRRQIVGCT
jgi:hypothetical protein